MSHIHNIYIRGLNPVWVNVPRVQSKDERALVGYCLGAVESIQFHHDGEEITVFPVFAKGLDMRKNIGGHEASESCLL
ncbi:hypothetical protein BDN72DRAFT_832051 [Pluteus cervinus]|uniref:Uncharacterized protein n=1 Tax=Pluteus cervinus TaxID=181527 RepID=A0ACD3BC91_9AGAR|nr:hypothetical protein BDN72DRAFT_832051 [Pluteus cervinus]